MPTAQQVFQAFGNTQFLLFYWICNVCGCLASFEAFIEDFVWSEKKRGKKGLCLGQGIGF